MSQQSNSKHIHLFQTDKVIGNKILSLSDLLA